MRAATLNGVEVGEWTTANIQQLLKTSERLNNMPVVILFGIAFCCNVLVIWASVEIFGGGDHNTEKGP